MEELTEQEKINLKEKASTLIEIMAKKAELEALEKELKDEIKDKLSNANINEFQVNDDTKIKLVEKTTYKYTDELSMIKWLEDNGCSQFIEKSIKKTALNKELNKGKVLTESLSEMYTKVISYSLNIGK